MEPCLFRHGKLRYLQANSDPVQLQWSHVFSDMVRNLDGRISFDLKWLQWSHVFSDMVRSFVENFHAVLFCFNGAMSFQTW